MRKFVPFTIIAAIALSVAACDNTPAKPATFGFALAASTFDDEKCTVTFTRNQSTADSPLNPETVQFWNVGTDSWQKSKFRAYEHCKTLRAGTRFRLPTSVG